MVNENDVKNYISKWLESFNCSVWWERKTKQYPEYENTFKSTVNGVGTTSKPDLLIKIPNGKYYLCETKNAEHKKNVYDALFQTIGYATNDNKYYLNGVELTIDGFLVATQHCLNGRLFESKHDILCSDFEGTSRMVAINIGELPRSEYLMTEQFTRIIWRGANHFNCKKRVGVLLSNVLNEPNSMIPMILYKEGKQQRYEIWK